VALLHGDFTTVELNTKAARQWLRDYYDVGTPQCRAPVAELDAILNIRAVACRTFPLRSSTARNHRQAGRAMRTLFVTLLLLFVAASATLIAYRNPGYVLISASRTVLETSLAVFLIIAAWFAVLYLCVRLLVRIVRVRAA